MMLLTGIRRAAYSPDHCRTSIARYVDVQDNHRVAVRPVRNYPMSRHDSPQGKLHFEVPRPGMEAMLDHAGKAYNGSVTIIWDPQI